jgi:hypothetical protein
MPHTLQDSATPNTATVLNEADALVRLHALPTTALFTSEEAGLYLNARTDLLRAWRCQGRGPTFIGRGHFVRYRKADLDQFLGCSVAA